MKTRPPGTDEHSRPIDLEQLSYEAYRCHHIDEGAFTIAEAQEIARKQLGLNIGQYQLVHSKETEAEYFKVAVLQDTEIIGELRIHPDATIVFQRRPTGFLDKFSFPRTMNRLADVYVCFETGRLQAIRAAKGYAWAALVTALMALVSLATVSILGHENVLAAGADTHANIGFYLAGIFSILTASCALASWRKASKLGSVALRMRMATGHRQVAG